MRRRKTQKEQDAAATLVSFGEAWRAALIRDDHETAEKARKQAEPIFKAHPQYMDRPPMQVDRSRRVSKEIFIRWQKFIAYPKKSVEL